jgi:hypothetical protein
MTVSDPLAFVVILREAKDLVFTFGAFARLRLRIKSFLKRLFACLAEGRQ